MAYGIDDIKSSITIGGGLAKSNLYRLTLPAWEYDAKELNILCKNVNLPGKQILTHDKLIGTINQKIAYGFAVEDVNVTFVGLNDYRVRHYFENWMDRTISADGNTAKYKNDYSRTVTIAQLDQNDDETYAVELYATFPTQLLNIELLNEANSLVDISATLAYTKWRRKK